MLSKSLKHLTVANISYNLLSKLLAVLLASATGIILARNLTAEDYGIVGFATIFISFLRQFNDMGVTASIIQKETVSEGELYTAFTLKLFFALVIFSLSFAWGSLGQRLFDNHAVGPVIIFLSAGFLISSLGFLPTTILTRELKFKRLAVPQVCSQTVAAAVAITTVYLGFSYWSLVTSELAAGITTVAVVFALCPVTFRLQWNREVAKEHLKFGSNLFFAELAMFLLFNADNFLVGVVGGAATLGFYSVAFNWSTKVQSFIGQATHPILLSTFSRVQQDTERLKRGYLTILQYVSFCAVWANVLLLSMSKELLMLVLGGGTSKWLPALAALKILCIYGTFRTVIEPVGCMVIAIGRPKLVFRANGIAAALQIALLYPALKYFGIEGVALAVTISFAPQAFIYVPLLCSDIGLTYKYIFRAIYPALLAGCALAAFGETIERLMNTSWLSLLVKLIFGSLLYLFSYGLVTRWKILKEAKEIIDSLLFKPSQSLI